MLPLHELYATLETIRRFLEQGGDVLFLILIVIFAMWVLIFERGMYLLVGHRKMAQRVIDHWEARRERRSWRAHEIRIALIAEADMALQRSLNVIKTLVAVCPLLGLLGTVTGMIEVFEVMAVTGSGSARAMADGISKATIPTMAGMVGALSGVFAHTWLQRNAKMKRVKLEEQLTFDH